MYRSSAVGPMSRAALTRLAAVAQSRNRAESITGLMLFDNGCFFQWLEGPDESVSRVLQSINDDDRHTDVLLLDRHPAASRVFPEWDMRLAGVDLRCGPGLVTRPDPQMLLALRRDPDDAVALLATLARPSKQRIALLLREVMNARVIPLLAVRHGIGAAAHAPVGVGGPVVRLALLVAHGDVDGAARLLEAARHLTNPLVAAATLVEPAARRLGDMWAQDALTEAEVTAALGCLRAAVRRASGTVPVSFRTEAGRVLVAPYPAEPHALGHVLHPEVLWHAGFAPYSAAPSSTEALCDSVSDTRYAGLDLSLSAAFRRRELLPEIADTIARVRRASSNPGLAIVLSGRAASGRVGADAISASALHLPATLRQAVAQRLDA